MWTGETQRSKFENHYQLYHRLLCSSSPGSFQEGLHYYYDIVCSLLFLALNLKKKYWRFWGFTLIGYWLGVQWLIVCSLAVGRGWELCIVLETFWGQEVLLLLISLSWDLSVNMAVLPSWVLQPPIYLNLTLYRRWLRGFVDVNSLHCILVVKRVLWGCSVNCLTVRDEDHYSIFCHHTDTFLLLKKFELWSPVIIFTSLVYIPGFILKELLRYNCQHLGIYPFKY